MFRYSNEAAFSKALVTAMRNKGWFVQRIESGETGKGIPDIFAITPSTKGTAMWLELKRVKHNCNPVCEEIPWRPGQQAWLNEVTRRGMTAYTLCCFNDMIVMIPHNIIYRDNLIRPASLEVFFTIDKLLGGKKCNK